MNECGSLLKIAGRVSFHALASCKVMRARSTMLSVMALDKKKKGKAKRERLRLNDDEEADTVIDKTEEEEDWKPPKPYQRIGRPTKLTPEAMAKLEALCKLNLSNKELAALIEVDHVTFWRWVDKYPGFAAKLEKWRARGRLLVSKRMYRTATTYGRDSFKAARYWLDRQHPDFKPAARGVFGAEVVESGERDPGTDIDWTYA